VIARRKNSYTKIVTVSRCHKHLPWILMGSAICISVCTLFLKTL
jgi:hypothetical protein